MTSTHSWKLRTPVFIGATAIALLVGGVGMWSTQIEIAGAVLGQGQVETEENKVTIQHLTGGIIEEILVADGDLVEAGHVLLRLDGTALRAELNTIHGELVEILAKEARLEAVIDERETVEIGGKLAEWVQTDAVAKATVARHQRLLEAGSAEAARKADLFRRKIAQVQNQVAAVDSQILALSEQMEIADIDLTNAERLIEQKLVRSSHFTGVRKDLAKLKGEAGRLEANRAELTEKSIEFELELLAIPADRRRLAVEEIGKLQPDKVKLVEKRIDLASRIDRLEIRAPLAGRVHDSQVAGLRSVVTEGKPIMWIVPSSRPAVAVVRIDASDIEQVYAEQETMLRFTAFNRRTTPMVPGKVLTVSADVLTEPTTRANYYEVRVSFRREDLQELVGTTPIPGMPLEAFFSTEMQTPFAYVTRPLVDYFNRAYRDT